MTILSDQKTRTDLLHRLKRAEGQLRGVQRMIEEGEIPRSYDDNGNPDPNGPITVTLDSMTTSANSNARLDTEFRVWRTDDQYCGYAEVEMPMFLELENELLGVRAGDITVVDGKGVGVLAVEIAKPIIDA